MKREAKSGNAFRITLANKEDQSVSLIRVTNHSWEDKETFIFISNFIKMDILKITLTNGILYLYKTNDNEAWNNTDDVVRAAARFLNVDVYYTDGTVVQISGCGEVDLKKFVELVECHMIGSFILSTKPELWDMDESRRLNAVLDIGSICMRSRKGMFGVVISCPVDRASDYELWILKNSTQTHITD